MRLFALVACLTVMSSLLPGCGSTAPLFRTEAPEGRTVVDRLRHDSERSVEPFLSDAVREADRLGPRTLRALLAAIRREPDARSFLALMVVGRIERRHRATHLEPEIRAAVLGDALRTQVTFNGWGYPGRARSEAVDALVALGSAARAVLLPLLDDERGAPHWGSAGATLAAEEGLRVKDYAAWLLALAARRPYEHVEFPEVRDARIDMLRSSLQ